MKKETCVTTIGAATLTRFIDGVTDVLNVAPFPGGWDLRAKEDSLPDAGHLLVARS